MRATSTQIRAFNAVAHEGSFGRAAKRLHVSQPAITLQVRRLEDLYGVVLFDRMGAKVRLTPVGRELFEITDQIWTLEEEVDELLTAQFELIGGSLTVATGSPHMTMSLLGAFRERHPQCDVTVTIGNAGENLDAVFSRRADIGCVTDPADDPRLIAIPYAESAVVALIPVGHPLARARFVGARTLAAERLIVRADKSVTQQMVARRFADEGVDVAPGMWVEGREAVQAAVAAGLGIGFVFDREAGEDTRIRAVPIGPKRLESVEKIVCLKAQARRRLVKAFLDTARALRPGDAGGGD